MVPAVAFVVVASFMASSCSIVSWRLGSTHGVTVEVGARRANVVIYRVARKAIYDVYDSGGTRAAQDVVYNVGKPPLFSFYRWSVCIGTSAARTLMKSYIYADASDFRGALIDAQRKRNCFAVTFVSQGLPARNWTTKSGGCYLGGLGRSAEALSTADAETPLLPDDGSVEPMDPNDYLPPGYPNNG
ncbi:hypothetical protein BH24ACT4_BH24ACT4_11430 [soil metagenome]